MHNTNKQSFTNKIHNMDTTYINKLLEELEELKYKLKFQENIELIDKTIDTITILTLKINQKWEHS